MSSVPAHILTGQIFMRTRVTTTSAL